MERLLNTSSLSMSQFVTLLCLFLTCLNFNVILSHVLASTDNGHYKFQDIRNNFLKTKAHCLQTFEPCLFTCSVESSNKRGKKKYMFQTARSLFVKSTENFLKQNTDPS